MTIKNSSYVNDTIDIIYIIYGYTDTPLQFALTHA